MKTADNLGIAGQFNRSNATDERKARAEFGKFGGATKRGTRGGTRRDGTAAA